MAKTLITCTCLGTQSVDAKTLGQALGLDAAPPCSALCTDEIARAAAALQAGDAVIACAQEAPRFEALAEELGTDPATHIDLRDRAGWSADTDSKLPKMSALLAEALLDVPVAKTLDVISEGLCLILGPREATLNAAASLKDHLSVTVLLPPEEEAIDEQGFDVIYGHLRRASGALGQFEVTIDALQQQVPGGRGARTRTEARDGGQSICDVLLDLTGGTPLFPAWEKREGYLRADPSHAPSVAKAVLDASHMIGTFEKPLYVKTEPLLCAHSRAEQTGCTRCLDLCPTSAIQPSGDHIVVDPMACAGCGACSAACPSGAISYDAPPVDATMRRVQTLAKTYLDAGGTAPRLVVVTEHGSEMIRLAARYGDGLPAPVVPLEVSALNLFGHAEITAALAAGFAHVTLVPGPGSDRDALAAQVALAEAIAGPRVAIFDEPDPDALSAVLYGTEAPAPVTTPVRPMGTRRQIARAAARALNPETEALPLPEGAPYGAVLVNTEACTLCLSCISLCPSGALGDNPDLPQIRFQEDACLQCGICASICPEDAIAYEPRLDLSDTALSQRVLNEEEPFACIECGTLFGSKSTIDRITEKLTGHSMFSDPAKLKMIQMCDDCRVNAQFHAEDNPFAMGERPKPRTTDDYLSKRKDH